MSDAWIPFFTQLVTAAFALATLIISARSRHEVKEVKALVNGKSALTADQLEAVKQELRRVNDSIASAGPGQPTPITRTQTQPQVTQDAAGNITIAPKIDK